MKSSRLVLLSVCLLFISLRFSACETSRPEPRRLAETRPTLTQVPVLQETAAIPINNTPIQEAVLSPTIQSIVDTPLPLPTPTQTPDPVVRFAVIGDFGTAGPALADVANLIKSWNPDFILTTGDNNYPSGSAETIDENIGQYFHEYIFPYIGQFGQGANSNRFFPTLGNHDWDTRGAKPYLDYFTLPGNERYYDLIWGPLHIFLLDADSREPDGVSRRSIQAQWFQEKITTSSLPWKLVVFHQSPYSSGYHGSVDWMQWPFAEWGATAVFSGHDHDYERLLIDGIPYFVNGLGGGVIYPFGITLDASQVRYNDDHGAMLVVADQRQITIQFYTRQGILIDSYQILAEN
jgi:hypothetical protein